METASKRLATEEGLQAIADAIKNTETVQMAKAEIQAEGETQVANVQEAAQEITEKVEKIQQNTDDVAELKGDLADIEDRVSSIDGTVLIKGWEIGSFIVSDETVTKVNNRKRAIVKFYAKKGYILDADFDTISFLRLTYSSDGINGWSSTVDVKNVYVIPNDGYYYMMLVNKVENNITDINLVTDNITLYYDSNRMNTLERRIDTVEEDIDSEKLGYITISWEIGSISADGTLADTNKRIRTIGYIPIVNRRFLADVSMKYTVYFYLQNGTAFEYLSCTTLFVDVVGFVVINAPSIATHYKVCISKDLTTIIDESFGNNFHILSNIGKYVSKKTKGCVTFVDDGCTKEVINSMKPLFDTHDKKFSESIVSDWVARNDSYLTWDDIVMLNDNGFEIMSHSRTHKPLPTLTKTEKFDEIYGSKKIITEHNIYCKNITYPENKYDDVSADIASNYYRACVGGNEPTMSDAIRIAPLMTNHINRVGLGAYQYKTLDEIKQLCLKAKQIGGWLVLMTHCYADGSMDAITEIFNYCIDNDIDIETFDDAYSRFESVN